MSDSNNIDWRLTDEERMLIAQWNRIMEMCTILIYILHGKKAFEWNLAYPKNAASEIMKAFHGKKWELAECKYEMEEYEKERREGGAQ